MILLFIFSYLLLTINIIYIIYSCKKDQSFDEILKWKLYENRIWKNIIIRYAICFELIAKYIKLKDKDNTKKITKSHCFLQFRNGR